MSDQDNKEELKDKPDQGTQDDLNKPLFSVDGRDYDKEAAVKKIENADSHISTLETESKNKDVEIATLKAQLDQAKKLEDVLQELRTPQSASIGDQSTTTQQDLDSVVKNLEEKLLGTVENKFTTQQLQAQEKANETASLEAAKTVLGSDYNKILRERAAKLGMSDEDIVKEAKGNPEKFKAVFGLNKESQPSVTPNPSTNTKTVLKPDKQFNFANKFSSGDKRNQTLDNMNAAAKKLGLNHNLS